MTKRTEPMPEGFHTVTPQLTVHGASAAIEFYKNAFGAAEIYRMLGPDGISLLHATIRIGDSVVMLNDEFPEGTKAPAAFEGSPVTIHLQVEDADSLFERAVRAGARVTMAIQDAFWGDRYGQIVDPFGHSWSIATHQEDLSKEEVQKRAAGFLGG